MRRLRSVLILLIVLLPAGPFATTFPVTKTADTNGSCRPENCSLREAIKAANKNPGADDVPVPAGTYLLTLGQLVVSDDVDITGAGQTNTIIDGNAADRVFDIEATSGLVEISDVTIRNGYYAPGGGGIHTEANLSLTDSTVSDNSAGRNGGGIDNLGGYSRLINSTVSGNTAGFGGGIANYFGVVTLTNSTVSGNTANHFGGGIANYFGDLTLTNSTVSDNSGAGHSGGGGIYGYEGDLTLDNSAVSNNTAYFGGGISHLSVYGEVTLTDSTVSGNTASFGGGIDSHGGYNVTVTNSTVSGNTAHGFGGGIRTTKDLTLTNSTVSGNTANHSGGGIHSFAANVTVTNSTVSGNTANYSGGGIYSHWTAIATLTNSTVSGNTGGIVSGYRYPYYASLVTLSNMIVADNGAFNCGGSGRFDSLGYNLTDDGTCWRFAEPGDLVVADAMLGPLQDNGGPTETHDLLPGSPAIDAGSMDCPPPDTDQRGVARAQGAGCDIGAVEYLPEPHHAAMLIAGAAFLGLLHRRRTRV